MQVEPTRPTKRTVKRDVLAGRAPDLQLYRAVRRYVQSLGGSIVVIGGIEVQEWPEDSEHCYRVAVRVLGRKPTLKPAPTRPT
jgi:hypothetical protein